MKGRILGFTPSAGSGAISGENGERFTFVAAQWRSDHPITIGTGVDFAPIAGVATEVYPVAAAMPIAVADLAASPVVQKLRGLATTTIVFPLAALLLLATLMPAISGTTLDPRLPAPSASLLGLGSLARTLSANPMLANDDVESATEQLKRINERSADLRRHAIGFGGMPMDNGSELQQLAKQRSDAERQLGSARFAATVANLLVLRWSVPIMAIILLWLGWTGRDTKRVSLAAGVAAIVTAAIVYEYRETIVGAGNAAADSIGAMLSKQMDAAISLGFGTYLIALCGVGLILGGLGVIRNPLADRAG